MNYGSYKWMSNMLKLASENNVIAVTNLMTILARKLRAVPSFLL